MHIHGVLCLYEKQQGLSNGKNCQESKLHRFSWESDTTVIEVQSKTTVVDMAVRALADEKGSDLMLWGGAFFLFVYFCYSFFASIFHFLFIYSYYSLAKQFFCADCLLRKLF